MARAVVYGTFAALVGLAALVLATIGAVRLIDNYLPDAVFGEEHTWATYLIIGLVFVIAGVVLWARRYGWAWKIHPPDGVDGAEVRPSRQLASTEDT